jgi:hypothetical protein
MHPNRRGKATKAIVRNGEDRVIFRTIDIAAREVMTSVKESSRLKPYVPTACLDTICKSNDVINDFYTIVSDEGSHDKHSKKELLGGKRKDKKDRKDRGYATLEGESSPDEDQETK